MGNIIKKSTIINQLVNNFPSYIENYFVYELFILFYFSFVSFSLNLSYYELKCYDFY